ncbi:MAG: DUF4350 domain-containing protein [Deltaproteobacteria bacterium]|nr:DUF4350 domain-containing protein [Deltaproteobacteria bacterium]
MRRRLTLVLGLAGLVLVTAMILEVARRGRFAVALSTYSTAARGAKALFLLCRSSGRVARRWTQDLVGLPRGRGVLVAVGTPWDGPQRELARSEREALLEWIRGGGTLVVLGASGYLPEEAGLIVSEKTPPGRKGEPSPGLERAPWKDPWLAAQVEARDGEIAAIPTEHTLAAGLGRLALRGPGELKITAGEWQRVLVSPKDALVLVRGLGRGRIAVAASASFVENGSLARGDHAALALRLVSLGTGPVLFDEYHLGMGSSRSVASYLSERGLTFVLVQGLLALALVLWRAGARFGAPVLRSRDAPPVHDAKSYVDALGHIYARAGDVRASMERVVTAAMGRVAACHGLDRQEPEGLARTLAERGRLGASRAVQQALERYRAATARGDVLGAKHLVELQRNLDRDLQEALNREGR